MDYNGNHYFTDVNIGDFAAGRPDVSYIIELNICHTTICYFRQIMHIFSFLNKWVEYFDPPFNSSHAVRGLSRVRQYPPWLLFAAFVDSVGYPRYNPQKTCKQ